MLPCSAFFFFPAATAWGSPSFLLEECPVDENQGFGRGDFLDRKPGNAHSGGDKGALFATFSFAIAAVSNAFLSIGVSTAVDLVSPVQD